MGPYGPQPGPGPNPDWAPTRARASITRNVPQQSHNLKTKQIELSLILLKYFYIFFGKISKFLVEKNMCKRCVFFLEGFALVRARAKPARDHMGPDGPMWAHMGPYGPIYARKIKKIRKQIPLIGTFKVPITLP